MRSKVKSFIYLILIILYFSDTIEACTTAIVSSTATPDGRPMLWKHRDADNFNNKIVYDDTGKFSYIGLINSNDATFKEVWAGVNETGFAIMNAASYNLNIGDTTKAKDQEGVLMKRALQSCSTLTDFERLLFETNSRRGIEANFGVIDAQGGAAYYETGNHSYTKLDVNDPRIAPFGYLIRTNFSVTGQKDGGYGYIRYQSAEQLFYQAVSQQALTPQFILQEADRSLYHSLTNTRLNVPPLPVSKYDDHFVFFRDYIDRYSSTASFLVHGVQKGGDINLTTVWTLLGFQPCSIAIPLWIAADDKIPAVITAKDSAHAEICDKALELKRNCFPIVRGSGKDYLNLALLLNQKNEGYIQQIRPLENEIIAKATSIHDKFRKVGFERDTVIKFNQWVDQFVRENYLKIQ